MGWSYCGKNTTTGDEMGYGVEGVCAEPGCQEVIDHGLSRLCGRMHDDGVSCNRYFCGKHLNVSPQRCNACWDAGAICEACDEWRADKTDPCICGAGDEEDAEAEEPGHGGACGCYKCAPDAEQWR
jgi:hypothetical protein